MTMVPPERRSAATGKVNIAYFTNWGIYGRNYQPSDIPVSQLTHIVYCFGNINADGSVMLSDTYSDLEKRYPTDVPNETGNNVYGCVKQLFLLKQRHRHLKVLFSIGGWTYSSNFRTPMSTAAGRTQFVNTAVTLVKDLGFDGIDIDWEYPTNQTEAENFVSLLSELRSGLDAYEAQYGGNRLQIAGAMPAGAVNYKVLHLRDMAQYIDFFTLMAYDFAGSFSRMTGHQANIYPSRSNPAATPFNTDEAIGYYLSNGVLPSQLALGMPLYGRAFANTQGLGQPFTPAGEGSWEAGIWDYKVLPQASADEYHDEESAACYSYDPDKKLLISYDNANSILKKMGYLIEKDLAGGMFWELSGDYKDSRSLVLIVYDMMKDSGAIDTTPITINYPASQYDNLRAGFPSG